MAEKAKIWPQLIAGFGAAMGGFNSGTVLGWTSSGNPLIRKMRESNKSTLNKEIESWIGGALNVGAVISLIMAIFLLDRIGRKWFMLGAVPLFIAGWILLALLDNDISFIVMRVVLGMAGGVFCVACPMYAAEIAETRIRGLLGTFFQLFLVHGILFSYLLGLTHNYLMICLLNLITVVIFAIWMLFMPMSPYFLLKIGKEEKAKKSLQWLRGKDMDIDDEFENIQTTIDKSEAMEKPKCKDFCARKDLRRSLLIGVLLMLCQQLSGINAVIFNMESIFKDAAAGEHMLDPTIQAIIVGIVQVVATFACSWTVEIAGRRILLMVSMLLMGVFHVGLAVYFFIKQDNGDETAQKITWLPILCLCGYIASFSLGAGPLPWSMMGEIFPEETKSVAASCMGILNWLLSLLVTKTYVNLKDGITTAGAFLLYACICIAGMILLFFFLPETKNREFEEIQDMLKGDRPDIAPIGLKR